MVDAFLAQINDVRITERIVEIGLPIVNDVSIWVKNSRVGREIPPKQTKENTIVTKLFKWKENSKLIIMKIIYTWDK